MGKKDFSLLQKLKPQFINGGKSNGHNEEILEKIWKDWEAFACGQKNICCKSTKRFKT